VALRQAIGDVARNLTAPVIHYRNRIGHGVIENSEFNPLVRLPPHPRGQAANGHTPWQTASAMSTLLCPGSGWVWHSYRHAWSLKQQAD
jgi:hypothetical protein